MKDKNAPSFPQRTKRYAHVAGAAVSTGVGVAGGRLFHGVDRQNEAVLLRAALGRLKGPLMKIGQLLAAIPDFLPREYAAELTTLQASAPPMGWPFVRRRMATELGADWQKKFDSFEKTARHAASLGQVHYARHLDGRALACKLQYPDMGSVMDADLQQLKIILGLFERFSGVLSTDEIFAEIAQRLREELDYVREARNMALYWDALASMPEVHVPQVAKELSTPHLLCMDWLEGEGLDAVIQTRNQEDRNRIASNLFRLWYTPFYACGALHGDPHPGNYTFCSDGSVNLLDFGCIRIFEPEVVQAVILLYRALRDNDSSQVVHAYELWGFNHPSKELIEALNIWAHFIYAPFLDDRSRPLEATNATTLGRRAASRIYQELKKIGGVSVPRGFVMMDRASIGLGSVFLRLGAEVNWFTLFNEMTEDFDFQTFSDNQKEALEKHDF